MAAAQMTPQPASMTVIPAIPVGAVIGHVCGGDDLAPKHAQQRRQARCGLRCAVDDFPSVDRAQRFGDGLLPRERLASFDHGALAHGALALGGESGRERGRCQLAACFANCAQESGAACGLAARPSDLGQALQARSCMPPIHEPAVEAPRSIRGLAR